MDAQQHDLNLGILGKRIRRAREKKNYSITELAGLLRSSESNVRRWENGVSNIRADTVHRLSAELNISYQEELYWLGLAGHLPATRLPSKEQVISLLEMYYAKIQTLTFPSYILDRFLTAWAVNSATIQLVGNADLVKSLVRQKTTLIDAVFDKSKGVVGVFPPKILMGLRRESIAHFLSINTYHWHEIFFTSFAERYASNLQTTDPIAAEDFRTIWKAESERIFTFQTPTDSELSAMIGEVNISLPIQDDTKIRFHVITQPIRELGSLFEVVYVYPHPAMDTHSTNAVREFFSEPFQLDSQIKIWELLDGREVDELLRTSL